MKHYYIDTSSLVKIYHKEAGTSHVLPIYKSQDTISISELSRIEFLSTISRKYREHEITEATLEALKTKFQNDLAHRYDVLKFSSLVVEEAKTSLERFGKTRGLKTLDSFQFAFFTTYCDDAAVFVCSDATLSQLVKDEGFEVLIP